MRIIDVAEHYSEDGGGVKTYIDEKLKNGSRLGHEIIIIAPGRENKIEERNGGKIIWVKGPRLYLDKRYGVFRDERTIHSILNGAEADIVEGSSIWAGGRFVSRWKGNALKLFIFHQDAIAAYAHTYLDKHISRKTIDRLFYPMWKYIQYVSGGFDFTIVSGDWLAKRLKNFDINRPIAVPFGINKSIFSASKRSSEIRRELLESCGRSVECPLLLAASRFHPEKRLRTLFESVRILNKSLSVGLVVYGEGVLSKADRNFAKVTPGIRLAGFTKNREELAEAYASSDVLIHGSAAETFGLGVAEAICSGLPVVAPSIGGAADLVGEANGYLYSPGNANECAQAVKKILRVDRNEWQLRLASSSGKINSVESHFEQLFEKYASLLEKKKWNNFNMQFSGIQISQSRSLSLIN